MSLSVRQRLLSSSLPLVALILILTGIGLDRAYQRYASDQELQKLQLQLWSLMADVEIENGQLALPEVLQEPAFSRPESNLLGYVIDTQGIMRWQSESVALSENLPVSLAKFLTVNRSGEMTKLILPGDQFLLRQGVSFVNNNNVKHNLTFVVVALGNDYRQQLNSYRQTVGIWFFGLFVVLLLVQVSVLNWGLRPLNQLAVEVERLELGEQHHLQADYPAEL